MDSASTEQPMQPPPENEPVSEDTDTKGSNAGDYDNISASESNKCEHQSQDSSSSTPAVEKEPETELVKYVFKDASRPDDIDGAVAVVQKVECLPPLVAEVAILEDVDESRQTSTSDSAQEQRVDGGETTPSDGAEDRAETSEAPDVQLQSGTEVQKQDSVKQEKASRELEPNESTETSPSAEIRVQSGPSISMKVETDQGLDTSITEGPTLQLQDEQSEEIICQHQENAALHHSPHGDNEPADKPMGLEVTPGVIVEGGEVKIQSDLKISSAGSLEKSDKKPKRKSRLPFKLKRSKPSTEQRPRSGGSLDRGSMKSFGENVRNLFGTVRSSVKRKRKPAKQESQPAPVRPPRPPTLDAFEAKSRVTSNDLDAHSLRSVDGPSITESPITPRRKLLQEALPDLMAAIPDAAEIHIQVSEMNDLSGKPTTPERDASPGAEIVHEEHIQPASVRRQVTLSHKSDASASLEDQAISPGSSSPKPPRPHNRPVLSPLDYQPYEPSLDGSCEPGEMGIHRAELVHASSQRGYDASTSEYARGKDAQQVTTRGTPREYREKTYSLDRNQSDAKMRQSSGTLRKTQTLRIDFADRMRERVRSLRVEPSDDVDASSTLGRRKGRKVKETYVCSDTVTWPKIHLKLKKKQSSVSKDAPRSVYEPVVHRPQPRITPYYQTNSLQRPPPPTGLTSEYISVSRADHVQSGLPPTVRVGINGPTTKTDGSRSPKSDRQLTSLLSISEEQSTVPYFSAEVIEDSTMGELKNLCVDNETIQKTPESQQDRINETVKRLQPFLGAWELLDTEGSDQDNQQMQQKASIHEFFRTCIRLRSVDLQGQFSPFHYPLPSFKEYYWIRCAKLADWNSLQIVREPEWNTEYAQLVSFILS
ncbi:unnamed protein product [Dicrocoelium dendriticum]|nr:unnamed protein product [Dicrocoelium dendriticum]